MFYLNFHVTRAALFYMSGLLNGAVITHTQCVTQGDGIINYKGCDEEGGI